MSIVWPVTGVCNEDEFSCGNGRCVSDGLVCNGYNPCGDYTDCSSDLAAGAIAGIIIGSIFFFVIVSVLAGVSIRRARRRRLGYVSNYIQSNLC